ncbi:hypothetical protein QSJ18_14380 [Gordonia sp. ABSL1-1]|uniref:hypothetical protein n=1 Tax=Gordonia sp. ABSL1-1 TaxID=3053923 RepID=UPI0025738F03|nr:hypothetical protein [Gordonia sp. ABSL1-1]MDL9937937.1 hypothetical protein [Gordonia sp. ABSL1-1]
MTIYRSEVVGRRGTDKQLQRLVKAEKLARLWPGAFADFADLESLDAVELHRSTVVAAARRASAGRVISHTSAAVVHRLPMLSPDLSRVHVTMPIESRRTKRVARHFGVLRPDEVTCIDGLWVTDLARTAGDVARLGDNRQALVILDAVLRAGVGADELESILHGSARRKGVEILRAALPLADARSESVGESLSRALISEWPDIPAPRLQVAVDDAAGRFIARVDFLFADRVVGEFDGMVKYSGIFGDDPPSAVVVKEKEREDRLRAAGYMVIRWTWADLMDPRRFRAVLLRGLRAAGVL